MRNDARPVGEHSPASPIGGQTPASPAGDHSPASPPGPADRNDPSADRLERGHGADERDARESVTHDRQSHIVHPSREGHGDETD
jgi:hypothetical protein